MKYVITLIIATLLASCGGGGTPSSTSSNQLTLTESHKVMAELNGKTIAPMTSSQSAVLLLIAPPINTSQ